MNPMLLFSLRHTSKIGTRDRRTVPPNRSNHHLYHRHHRHFGSMNHHSFHFHHPKFDPIESNEEEQKKNIFEHLADHRPSVRFPRHPLLLLRLGLLLLLLRQHLHLAKLHFPVIHHQQHRVSTVEKHKPIRTEQRSVKCERRTSR